MSTPPPGWPAPQGGYPPYAPPGYPPYPGYPPPYPGYPPPYPGYPPPYPSHPGHPALWKPGVIPLRPLSLSDVFNGAVNYVRANPLATLGLTTLIVVITSILDLALELGQPRLGDDAGLIAAFLTSAAVTALATILLSGMLTVVVARAVLGSSITITEAWGRVRGRLPALIALSLLEILAVVVLAATAVLIIAGVAGAANGVIAALIGVPLVLAALAGIAYLFTVLTFAPVAIVLERKPVLASVRRSFALARNRFWRILGIRLLATLVATVVSAAVLVPFAILGGALSLEPGAAGPGAVTAVLTAVGSAVGQIITAPFTAGVVVLLYVDARIRSEAFDLVLHTGASPGRTAAHTDDLWLTPGE